MPLPDIAYKTNPVPGAFIITVLPVALHRTTPELQQEVWDVETDEVHDVAREQSWDW